MEFKFHLFDWNTMCFPMKYSGLGVRKLTTFNQALLGKWLWCSGVENDHFWILVVGFKYGVAWGEWTYYFI